MSRPRPPIVAGADPGAGASTLAAALHGHDAGCHPPGADILVCPADAESLRRAAAALSRPPTAAAATPPRAACSLMTAVPPAVLAVRATAPDCDPPAALLLAATAAGAAVVVLPPVGMWHGLPQPSPVAPGLLGHPPEFLQPALRAYAAALRQIVAALAGSGRLHRPAPLPRRTRVWPGLLPIERFPDRQPAGPAGQPMAAGLPGAGG